MNEKMDKEQVMSIADIYIHRHGNELVLDVRAGRP